MCGVEQLEASDRRLPELRPRDRAVEVGVGGRDRLGHVEQRVRAAPWRPPPDTEARHNLRPLLGFLAVTVAAIVGRLSHRRSRLARQTLVFDITWISGATSYS